MEPLEYAWTDLLMALPAAAFRVLLEWRARPGVALVVTAGEKARALALSLLAAILAGQVARAYPASTQYVPLALIIIGSALMGQELGMRGLPWLRARLFSMLPPPKSTKKPDEN